MRKYLILISLGTIIPIGLLGIFLKINGSPVISTPATPTTVKPFPTTVGAVNTKVVWEDRDPDGTLLRNISAEKVTQRPNGQSEIEDVVFGQYAKNGDRTVITAQRGFITMDPLAPSSTKVNFKNGTFSGNVTVTFGPEKTFVANSGDRHPGQFQARIDDDVTIEFESQQLISPGVVHLRGDRLSFDGKDMKLMFNKDQRHIEFLRINQGDKIVIKDVGKDGIDPLASKDASTTGVTPVIPPGATAVAPAVPAAASTKPADAPIIYRLDFGHDVKAVLGTRSLSADELNLLFQMGGQDTPAPLAAPTPLPVGPTPAAPGSPAAAPPAAAVAAPTAPIPTLVPPQSPVEPMPVAGPDDLTLTWSGPMIMKPYVQAAGQPAPLLNAKDRRLEASGSINRPVVIRDGDTVTARSGVVSYSTALQHAVLEPGEYKKVEAVDTTKGAMQCQRIDFLQADNQIILAGPGAATVLPAVIRHNAKPDAAPLTARWKDKILVTLAKTPDPKDNTKSNLAVKHATLTGDVDIRDPEFSLHSDKLDVSLTSIGGTGVSPVGGVPPVNSATTALDRLLATGNVFVQSSRTAPDGRILPPDSIKGQSLDLTTALHPGSNIPQPDKLQVDGDVDALTWQPGHTDDATGKKSYGRQRIQTPSLTVELTSKTEPRPSGSVPGAPSEPRPSGSVPGAPSEPRPSGSVPGAPSEPRPSGSDPTAITGGIAIKSLSAKNGVQLALEGLAKDTVVATADSLTADALAGTADLTGNPGVNGKGLAFSHIIMGDNQIAGMNIHLNQKTNSIEIPANGDFIFVQPPAKPTDQPSPVHVTWSKHMSFDGKTNLATFEGNTSTSLLGKPNEESQLNADTLIVQLASNSGTGVPPTTTAPDSASRKLQQITAKGHVTAYGATFDPAKKPLTRMLLKDVDQLVYTETNRTLKVLGKGKLGIEDYRPDPADKDPNKNNGARGATAFEWKDGLTYAGDTGLITLTKDVLMRHQPTHPIKLAKNQTLDPKAPPQVIELQCQSLVATLLTTANSATAPANVTSPVALGNNGQVKVNKVTATTGAQLTVDKNIISADVLDFDTIKNVAIATSQGEHWAQLVRPPEAMAEYRAIRWNFTTGQLDAVDPRVVVVIPPSSSGLSPIPMQP